MEDYKLPEVRSKEKSREGRERQYCKIVIFEILL